MPGNASRIYVMCLFQTMLDSGVFRDIPISHGYILIQFLQLVIGCPSLFITYTMQDTPFFSMMGVPHNAVIQLQCSYITVMQPSLML